MSQTGNGAGISRRRILLAGAAGLVAGPILAGCTAPGGAGSASPPKKLTGTVVVWTPTAYPFNDDVGGEMSRAFMAKYPGITVDAQDSAGNSSDKLTTAIAAGQPPDMSSASLNLVQTYAFSGIARSLEDYLKASKETKKADIWPSLLFDCTYQSKLHGIPHLPDLRIMYVNTDRYRSAGLDPANPPKSWADFEAAIAKTFRATGNEIEHLSFDPTLGSGYTAKWLIPFWQLGGEQLSADGTKLTFFNDKGIQAMEWFVKLINMQKGWDSFVNYKQGDNAGTKIFIAGRVTHFHDTHNTRASTFAKDAPELKYSYFTYPIPPNGKRANYGGGSANIVISSAKNPDAGWAFIEHISSVENNLKWAIRYDRIPIRIASAKSAAYTRNDPFLVHAADEMQYRKFIITAPGSADVQALERAMVLDIYTGKASVSDSLRNAQDGMQKVLDKWRK